ncbi:hypothetical protein C9424_00555 [Arthrobacter sp. H-02-3]|nr:hypothetical protein C9424_00555 [Arthrobacter sp. H-02-3]
MGRALSCRLRRHAATLLPHWLSKGHGAWPLYRAHVTRLEDQLVRAAGIEVGRPPESVLFSPGVRTQFGRPRVLNRAP